MTRRRSTAAAVCGLAAAALAFLVTTLGARAESHYSHVSQFISELGAAGAANAEAVAAGGFAPIGLLVLAFLALASSAFPRSRRTTAGLVCLAAIGVAYLVAAVFPCDAGCPAAGSSSQAVHHLFGFLEYVGAITGLLILASTCRRSSSWRHVAAVSVVAACAVAIGLVAMLTPALGGIRGLSQRVAETGIFGWIGYLSIVLWQRSAAANGGAAHRSPAVLGVLLALAFALWELPFAAFMADDYVQVGILEHASQITWIGPLEL